MTETETTLAELAAMTDRELAYQTTEDVDAAEASMLEAVREWSAQ